MKKALTFWMAVFLVCVGPALADFTSGSDGNDGVLAPAANLVINLAQANNVPPGDPAYVAGRGYYDPDLWVVVFNYQSISIPSGVTVSFQNHSSGCPVIWLSQQSVTISGTVVLDGTAGAGSTRTYAAPGPGGFFGGMTSWGAWWATGGFGPGGPNLDTDWDGGGTGGSYATQGAVGGSSSGVARYTYGNQYILPLIGGSGGAGGWSSGASQWGACGGAGGGAILIASSETIYLNGTVQAYGGAGGNAQGGWTYGDGGGGGAGGAMRLMADTITGGGILRATGGGAGSGGNYGVSGGGGGNGRTRVEATHIELSDTGSPAWTSSYEPGLVYPPANYPKLRVTRLTAVDEDGNPIDVAIPAEPNYSPTSVEVNIQRLVNPVTVYIEANNIPTGTTVQVHVIPKDRANAFWVSSTALTGTLALSTATASITLQPDRSEIQLNATWVGLRGEEYAAGGNEVLGRQPSVNRPLYRQIHDVVGIEAVPGSDQVTYITGDGRRVTYPVGLVESAPRPVDRTSVKPEQVR